MNRCAYLTAVLLWVGLAVAGAEELSAAGARPLIEKPRMIGSGAGALSTPGIRLRLCTYNIENLVDGHDDGKEISPVAVKRRARQAAAFVDEIGPDILVMQEVENEKAVSLLNSGLAEPFPIGYVTDFSPPSGNAQGQEKLNIAVLSRYALHAVREFDFGGLSGDDRPPRGALSFCVELGNRRRLLVYVVHLKSNWGEAGRNRAQRRQAMEAVRRDADAVRRKYADIAWEIVVAGDMNVDPQVKGFEDDPTLEPFADWHDLWRARAPEERVTVPTRHGDADRVFPPAAFDRFIVSKELSQLPWVAGVPRALPKGVDTRNTASEPGRSLFHVSDHYPVYLDLLREF